MTKPNPQPQNPQAKDFQGEINDAHLKNLFTYQNRKIAPVEQSTFFTMDFSSENCSDAILFSTQLNACACLIIKNKNPEHDTYDNVVTMAHFYPTNGLNSDITIKNLLEVFKDFTSHGGKINSNTSVILAGGAVLEGEDIAKTCPLGALIEGLEAMKEKYEFKFNHHQNSISKNLSDPLDGSVVFVDKNGTSILKTQYSKTNGTKSFLPLTQSKDSMPEELLVSIANTKFSYYPPHIKNFFDERDKQISKANSVPTKPQLAIENKQTLLKQAIGQFQEQKSRDK